MWRSVIAIGEMQKGELCWDAAFTPRSAEKIFKQVHADKEYAPVMEKINKARDLDLRELMVVEDKVVPAKASSNSGGQ